MQRPETKARARALQILYAWELTGEPSIETVVARISRIYGSAPEGYDRGADLAARAAAGRAEYDRRIADAAEHWRLSRVAAVERNILRLALAELDEGLTPPKVVIAEAIKLAHWFAGSKAPAFVNGVLDAVARELGVLRGSSWSTGTIARTRTPAAPRSTCTRSSAAWREVATPSTW
ncbi:MAG: transcription antitermination factor NusB [Gemmatimonadetes bacterium]|nr:MAG: transcription antitermination factor NusB [Gemmatimonadota bacterium]